MKIFFVLHLIIKTSGDHQGLIYLNEGYVKGKLLVFDDMQLDTKEIN